jgi:osmotically-inducible protein OsmY
MTYDRDRNDRDRYERDRYERDRYDRDRYGRDDRGMLNRAGDEVRSWFGDDEAQRRRERDERESERWNREERSRNESNRSEGYRDYGDRYGRSYSAPIERSRFSASEPEERDRPFGGGTSSQDYTRGPAFQAYTRGSQEFGPEGYGSPTTYGAGRSSGREWASQERWRVPGPHAGRGPKGYQRPEERIREEINDRLTAHGLVDATDVEVRIQSGEVTLTGFVDSRAAKRAAEDCADDVQGVREVHNHLRIRTHADDTGVGRTSVLGLTEHETQTAATAREADATARSRPRNQ